ncbi:multidrug resistance protein mdtB, partial [mine drainage metagenome]
LIGSGATNPTPNTGGVTIVLKPISQRSSINTVMRELSRSLDRVPGLRFYMQPVQDITLSSRIAPAEYQYTLTDTNASQLEDWSQRIETMMRSLPELRDVSSDQQDGGLAAYVDVDRAAAARLGVSMSTIENVLYDAFGQRQISTIYTSNAQYRVVLGVGAKWATSPAALDAIYVPAGGTASASVNGQGPASAVSGSATLSIASTPVSPIAEVPLGDIARVTVRHTPLVTHPREPVSRP